MTDDELDRLYTRYLLHLADDIMVAPSQTGGDR